MKDEVLIDAVVKADQTEIFGDEKLVGSRALAALIVPDHFVRLLIEETDHVFWTHQA